MIAHGNRTETYVETVEGICASSCIGNNCATRRAQTKTKGILDTIGGIVGGITGITDILGSLGSICLFNCGDTINQPQPLPENHYTWACPWTRIGHQ